jgi:hypothetical protein
MEQPLAVFWLGDQMQILRGKPSHRTLGQSFLPLI